MTTPTGPWRAIRWGNRWSIENVLDDRAKQPLYDTHADAQHEAQQRNGAYERDHAPRPPQPQQAALFNTKEAS